MREAIDVEIRPELTIRAHVQVFVEGRGDAKRIVVGEQQLAFRFYEIRAEEERVAPSQRGAHAVEKRVGTGRIEVADVRSQKQYEHPAAGSRLLRGLCQS